MAKASKQVLLRGVILAGNSLLKKSAFDDAKEPDYNGRILIPKDSEAAAAAIAAIKEVYQEEFGKDAGKPAKYPLHSGEELEGKAGFDDTVWYMNFKSDEKPRLFAGKEKDDIWEMPADERTNYTYPGAVGNLLVRFYAWGPGKYGKGVGVGLRGWQFMKDGERIGGSAPASENDFPDLDEEEAAGDDWL